GGPSWRTPRTSLRSRVATACVLFTPIGHKCGPAAKTRDTDHTRDMEKRTSLILGILLTMTLSTAWSRDFCSYENTNQLSWDPAFPDAIRSFFGERMELRSSRRT